MTDKTTSQGLVLVEVKSPQPGSSAYRVEPAEWIERNRKP